MKKKNLFDSIKEVKLLNPDYDMFIEPENPIMTKEEFTNEIMKHFHKEDRFVTMTKESMEPEIEIDGEKYICRLGEPFRTNKMFKFPVNPIAGRFLGYKFIYIYKEKK